MPGLFLREPDVIPGPAVIPGLTGNLIRLIGHQGGDSVSELRPDLFQGDIRIFYGIVQGGGRQEFLVGSHRSHDSHGFQRMDDIRIPLPAAFRPRVGADGKDDGAVQQFGIQGFVGHKLLIHKG